MKNRKVIMSFWHAFDKMVGNKYFMSKDECQQLLDISNHGEKNTKSKTDTIKLHVRMVEQKMNGKFVYNDINNMKESTSMLKAVWKNQVKELVGKMKYT